MGSLRICIRCVCVLWQSNGRAVSHSCGAGYSLMTRQQQNIDGDSQALTKAMCPMSITYQHCQRGVTAAEQAPCCSSAVTGRDQKL